jgi:hypothetical protein
MYPSSGGLRDQSSDRSRGLVRPSPLLRCTTPRLTAEPTPTPDAHLSLATLSTRHICRSVVAEQARDRAICARALRSALRRCSGIADAARRVQQRKPPHSTPADTADPSIVSPRAPRHHDSPGVPVERGGCGSIVSRCTRRRQQDPPTDSFADMFILGSSAYEPARADPAHRCRR